MTENPAYQMFGTGVSEGPKRPQESQLPTRHIRRISMPEKKTIDRAKQDAREGKAPSTQAGEFVHEEIEHVKQGKHGARSTKQAIAIGLSKARRAGVKLPPPKNGASAKTKKQAKSDEAAAKSHRKPSAKRSRATSNALKREGRGAVSHRALSKQAKSAAKKRSASSRSASARKAATTRRAHRS
jgi:hypothetical protein